MQSLILNNFTLRNVIIIIIINIIINDVVVVVDFLRLQFSSREALAIELKLVSFGSRVEEITHTHMHASTRLRAYAPTHPRDHAPTLPCFHARTDGRTDGRAHASTRG